MAANRNGVDKGQKKRTYCVANLHQETSITTFEIVIQDMIADESGNLCLMV